MSGMQKNTSRLLDTILLKIIVALCVALQTEMRQ